MEFDYFEDYNKKTIYQEKLCRNMITVSKYINSSKEKNIWKNLSLIAHSQTFLEKIDLNSLIMINRILDNFLCLPDKSRKNFSYESISFFVFNMPAISMKNLEERNILKEARQIFCKPY